VLSGALCLGLVCGRVQGRWVGVGGDGYKSWEAMLLPDFGGRVLSYCNFTVFTSPCTVLPHLYSHMFYKSYFSGYLPDC
jgi:hypothetical protein